MSRQGAMLVPVPPGVDPWAAAPFDPRLSAEVRQLLEKLDPTQRVWLSGYLVGSLAPAAAFPQQQPERPPAIVLFGSQTGNAERLAHDAARSLRERGIPCVTMDMIDCRKADLASAATLIIVVSTQGDGDPPDRALALWELLSSRKAPRLDHLRYSVLALGDSSYDRFCETGRQFDKKLEELGARRLHDRVECDVDFEAPAKTWTQTLVDRLASENSEPVSVAAASSPAPVSVANAYTRKNPFLAEVLANQRLTVKGSTKDVRHIELSLAGSHIRYEPGDAIGIVPRNSDVAVDELVAALPFDAEASLSSDPDGLSLRQALATRFEIGAVTSAFLKKYGEATQAEALLERSSDGNDDRFRELARGRDLVDIVREHPPANLDATSFAALLRPLAPRLYSIASSLHASPDEAHLTVSVARHEIRGHARAGVVSGMLASLEAEQASIPIYLHRNSGFRLPAPDVPIIMIGPGTGVAPFRAFIAERAALDAKGRNWLFFGDRSFETDFLYQAEWLAWRKQGVLTRLDVAFSRDRKDKVYVQHRMLESGRTLWAWLAEGAHVYVCGDANRMAPDVHAALLEIVRSHGGHSEDSALEYVSGLQRDRRYQRDVY